MSLLRAVRSLLRDSPLSALGGLVVALFLALLVAQPVLAPAGMQGDLTQALSRPSARHPLGTDSAGVAVAARIVQGTRYAFVTALPSALIALALGGALGLLGGLAGGLTDRLLRRLYQAVGLIPAGLLALALVAALGANLATVVIALALLNSFMFYRVTRDRMETLRASRYIESAVAAGNPLPRLVLVHLLPDILRTSLAQLPSRIAWAFQLATLIGFLGMGLDPAATGWGGMLREGADRITDGTWWMLVFPGIAVILLGFALQLLGALPVVARMAPPAQRRAILAARLDAIG